MSEKGWFSYGTVLLSVLTGVLIEPVATAYAAPQGLCGGIFGALCAGGLVVVLYPLWSDEKWLPVWKAIFSVWLCAELFQTVWAAQQLCLQAFSSMAVIGLLPLLLWAGFCILPERWEAPGRVLWWLLILCGAVFLAGVAGQFRWERLALTQTDSSVQTLLYAEFFLLPMLCKNTSPKAGFFLPVFSCGVRAGIVLLFVLLFSGRGYPAQELLRAWSLGAFSRMDTLLALLWLTCAVLRICFLAGAARRLLFPKRDPEPKGVME